MDFYVLQVINLYQHNVIYRAKKSPKKSHRPKVMMFGFALLLTLAIGLSFTTSMFGETLRATAMFFSNPITQLYGNMGGVINTSNTVRNSFNTEKDINLVMPFISNNVQVQNNGIDFVVDSNLVVSAAYEGVVETVGLSVDGQRFIVIKHTRSISTRYENIDIAGVRVGDIVTTGQNIATASSGNTLTFRVLINTVPASSYTITGNSIVWEN